MKLQDAIQLFGLDGEIDFDKAKHQYRVLSSKYHPDRNPAGLVMMQSVNDAWSTLQHAFDEGWNVKASATNDANYGDDLNTAINSIIDCEGLEIELCGAWLWIGGDTKPYKDILKGASFRWAGKKQKWYFRPENYKSKARGKFSMSDIREFHGSEKIETKHKTRLHA